MTRVFSIFVAILMLSCQQRQDANQPAADALTSQLDSISKQGIFNGFSVAIVNDKGILYEKGLGMADVAAQKPYTEQTIQNIASVSKTLIGIALLKAQELGKLKLDDPINRYLPFDVVHPNFPNDTITIRHLATHTSGILDNEFYMTKNYCIKSGQDFHKIRKAFDDLQVFNPADSLLPLEKYLNSALSKTGKWRNKDTFLKTKPGATYEYSNTGATLAAFIIERATGQPFDAFTKQYILEPLGMKASGWHFKDVDLTKHARLYADPKTALPFYTMSTYPDGNFITSAHDLGLFLSELIKGYDGRGTILNKESFREYFRPQLTAENFVTRDTKNPYNDSFNTGIFIGFGYSGYVGHTGGDPGVATMLFLDPKQKIGRLLILNTSFSGKQGGDAFYGIWNALEKHQNNFKN